VNVVFDLGGVLVTWKPQEFLERAFPDPAQREIARREIMDHPDWLEIDRGTVTIEELIPQWIERSGLPERDVRSFIDNLPLALTAMHDTVDLMYRVKAAGHRIFCLSNMPHETFAYLERTHGFWDAFEGMVISARIGHCKPEPAIYEHLLRTYGLKPSETVFIDDMPANIEAARTMGIHGIQFQSAAQVESELRRLGVLSTA
jgi:putative hydrolase of the HAD superfamily